ncbi:hypothetical protein BZA05DRAFT_21099 [Tricharina praecox]|uniref:uncharacterized protein n=1 Tax=Tricharina praecox TaxID=43433 RepID=UPI0022211F0E|nr:uncharacterized protein BZA05DRAFT_21099 [Tricharina praecox]KAI5859084.1 hypothetical protein BZA05DRAFT_21099 [Tricharina praecox]
MPDARWAMGADRSSSRCDCGCSGFSWQPCPWAVGRDLGRSREGGRPRTTRTIDKSSNTSCFELFFPSFCVSNGTFFCLFSFRICSEGNQICREMYLQRRWMDIGHWAAFSLGFYFCSFIFTSCTACRTEDAGCWMLELDRRRTERAVWGFRAAWSEHTYGRKEGEKEEREGNEGAEYVIIKETARGRWGAG